MVEDLAWAKLAVLTPDELELSRIEHRTRRGTRLERGGLLAAIAGDTGRAAPARAAQPQFGSPNGEQAT